MSVVEPEPLSDLLFRRPLQQEITPLDQPLHNILWNLLLFFKLVNYPKHSSTDAAGAMRSHAVSGDPLKAGKQESESPKRFFHHKSEYIEENQIPVKYIP